MPQAKARDARGEWTGAFLRVRDKVLGKNMLWNFLHRYRRGADADEEGHIGNDPIDKLTFAGRYHRSLLT